MRFDVRESGLPLLGDLPWGSRFCQFYETKDDLLEILVPYFKAGLEGNEACLWLTREPLFAADAVQALARAFPRLDSCVKSGQLEVVDERDRPADQELSARLTRAVAQGFDGLRLAHQTVPQGDVRPPAPGEAGASRLFNVVEACAYPRDRFDALRLLEVAKVHRFALVRNSGRWERVESSEASVARAALERNEAKLEALFKSMSEGFAFHRIVLDGQGRPCDYVFLEISESFERLTGLKGVDIVGRRATEVLPGLEKDPADWIGRYGSVALTGAPAQFENRSEALGKWFAVSAFSPHQGFFAVTFSDITERKRGEETLRRSHAALAEAERIAGIGSWEWEVDSGVLRWSDQLYRIFGEEPGAFAPTYESFLARIHPEDRGLVEQAARQAATQGKPFSLEYRVPAGQETPRVVLAQAEAVAGPDGRTRRVVGTALDITERRQAEQELRAAHQQLVLAQQYSGAGVWNWDIASGRLAWSPEMFRIFGLDPAQDEASFPAWRRALHPEDREAAEQRIQAAVRDRARLDSEYRLVLPAGDIRWVNALGTADYDATGRPLRMAGICLDITARKRAELELAQARAQEAQRATELQAVLDVASVAVWIAHDPQCLRITGNRTADELVMRVARGANISASAKPGDAAVSYRVFRGGVELKPEELPSQVAAATGKPVNETELELRFSNGRSVQMLMGAVPLFDSEGRMRGSVAAGMDITERKRSEEALRRHSEELRASNEELERFNLAMVDREQRMIELKKEVNELCGRLGQPAAYACDFDAEAL